MNTCRLIGIVFMLLVCLTASASGNEEEELLQRAQEALTESVPALEELWRAHPNDVEILTGLANLVGGNHYYLSTPGMPSLREQYERIAAIDPDNRLANAVLAQMRTSQFVGKTGLLRGLANKIDYSKQQGLDRLRLVTTNQFSKYLNEHAEEMERTREPGRVYAGPSVYLLIDFDVAERLLREGLEAEAVPVLEILDDTQAKDPDNGIYDYLRARIYLQFGDIEAVLAAMEAGAQKKYVKQYVYAAERAERRVLDEIGFPEDLRMYVGGARTVFGVFIHEIWKKDSSISAPEKGLSDVAAEYEAKEEFEKAESIYRLLVRAGEQCSREQYGTQSGLIKIGQERLDALGAKLDRSKGAGLMLYAAVAGIFLCMLAVVLSLRGRATKLSGKAT